MSRIEYIIIENDKIGQVKAQLLADKNPETCKAIWEKLPFDVNLSRWGEELYGEIPVAIGEENSQVDCEIGDIGYWPAGNGFCIFWGPTPASRGDKPVAASPVNIFAKIEGDPKIFNQFKSFKGRVLKGD
ncbi:MAG: cyclophilin-like fold protein [Candidatus Hodarchaeota archaeon]